jgi:hypothetical protein
MDSEIIRPLSPDITRQSNLDTGKIAAIGSYRDIGSSGAIDMGGNQREWTSNEGANGRYTMGGSWEDEPYLLLQAVARTPWDRSPANGFRCAVYPEDSPPEAIHLAKLNTPKIDFRAIKPISDDVFDTLVRQGDYGDIPLEAAFESSNTDGRTWNTEFVSIAGVDGSRLLLQLFLPKNPAETLPAVVFFPGLDSVMPTELNESLYMSLLDFIPKSGRALIIPHYRGLWENSDGSTMERLSSPAGGPRIIREWTQDFGRALEYVKTRSDIRDDPAFMGLSLGTVIGNFIVPHYNDTLSCAVFSSGGFSTPNQPMYAPRITLPTLMVNGDTDYIFPVEQTQLPLFDMLGTAPEHKKHVVFHGGHMPQTAELARETLECLDRYQPLDAALPVAP